MNKIFLVILLFNFSFSQDSLGQQELIQSFKNSPQLLDINLLLPNRSLGIRLNKNFVNYDQRNDECAKLKFNAQENLKVINLMENFNLFDSIYSIKKTGYFFNIESNETIKPSEKTKLYIELIFKSSKSQKANYYILIIEKKKSVKKFIDNLSELTDEKKCFKNFKRKL
jgi:hypothetical protein